MGKLHYLLTVHNTVRHLGGFFTDIKVSIFREKFTNIIRPLVKSAYQNFFSYLSMKTYVVGTQKNHLNETVLLSTQNICQN